MMRAQRIVKYLPFWVLILFSCEKRGDIDTDIQTADKLVINALMTDIVGRQEVFIHYLSNEPNAKGKPVSGARVFLSNEDTIIQFKEDSLNPGCYFSITRLQIGKTHTLQVFSGTDFYSAKAVGAPPMEFNAPVFEREHSNGLYYPVFIAPTFLPDWSAMYIMEADWSQVPGYEIQPEENCKVEIIFFTLPTLNVTQLLPPPQQSMGLPEGTIIRITRYSLTDDHARYWREVLLETRWAGGLFAVESANVPTNFTGGAIGWFGICGVSRISITLGQ